MKESEQSSYDKGKVVGQRLRDAFYHLRGVVNGVMSKDDKACPKKEE